MPRRRSTSATPESAPQPRRRGRPRKNPEAAAGAEAASAAAAPRRKRRGRRRVGAKAGRGSGIPTSVVALSRALREARSNAGLTQRAAADRVGIHFVTLYTWESEQQPAQPSAKNLAKAARIYHTTPDAIQRRASELEAQAAAGGLDPLPETRGRRVKPLPRRAATARAEVVDEPAPQGAAHENGAAESPTMAVVVHETEGAIPGVSRRVYGRVLRLLADLADQTDLSPTQLVGVQRALTSPALLGVFTTLTRQPHQEDDVIAAVDAAAVAVRTFVASRRGPIQKGA